MRPADITTVFITMLLALIFQLYPWSGQGVILRPDFLFIVTLYWVLRAPNLCNVGVAWFAGLMVDLSTGSLLGQHMLAFAFSAYLALQYQRRLVLFSRWQLSGYALALIVVERLILLFLKLFADNEAPNWSYLLPIITSFMLWQLMVITFGSPTRPKHS